MNLNDPVNIHALRYAEEKTKVFQLQRFQKRFPEYFQFARMETRIATSEDYYVPPSLANESVVVTRTWFEEEGCRRLSCFYVRDENWNLCEEDDRPRWISIGDRFELACQGACLDHSLNTDWIGGRCVVANPYKKMLAAMPENVFGKKLRHVYHRGLNVRDGTLKLNEDYCKAYGLDFADDDCVLSGPQSFGEWLFGVTVVRAAKTAHLPKAAPRPPPLPAFAFTPRKKPKKRALEVPSEQLANELEKRRSLLKEMAAELVREARVNATEYAVERFLVKKAPKLLAGAVDSPAGKLVLKHSAARSLKRYGTAGLKGLGRAFGAATSVYAIYDVAAGLLDMLDQYSYMHVLDKKALQDIDEKLDFDYFQGGRVGPEMTPEFVWENNVLTPDEEGDDALLFMVERVEEYLAAVRATSPDSRNFASAPDLFAWRTEEKGWDRYVFAGVAFVLSVLAFLMVEWINVWANVLFFIKVYFQI